MNFEELNELTDKIIKNGIEIKDKKYLKQLYENNDYDMLFNELDEILINCESPRLKLCYTFGFYIGFFNINSKKVINELPDITELNSYNLLKGGLMLYFKDEMKIKYNYPKVTPYSNKYSFVAKWYPIPFSVHNSLTTLLKWIYKYDEKQFYQLIFSEKHNYIFLSIMKGSIIKNFNIKSKHINWNSQDDIKLYGLFNYLMVPCTNIENIRLKDEELNIWNCNKKFIPKINHSKIIKIIMDYIRFKETKIVPAELFEIVKDNLEQFYKEYDDLKNLNINEIKHLYLIKQCSFLAESRLFEMILKKIKLKLSEDYITINEYDWKDFIYNLDSAETMKILNLLEESKNNLTYTSELDKEIRFKKYLIDTQKYDKINELINICNENINHLI